MRDRYAWERLTAYEERLVDERIRTIRRPPRGRVRRGYHTDLYEPESANSSEPTTAELLERAHESYAERDYLMVRVPANEVLRRASASVPQRADALRVRAMADALYGDWDGAIEAGEQALALEPYGTSVEVSGAELTALIPVWRELLLRS